MDQATLTIKKDDSMFQFTNHLGLAIVVLTTCSALAERPLPTLEEISVCLQACQDRIEDLHFKAVVAEGYKSNQHSNPYPYSEYEQHSRGDMVALDWTRGQAPNRIESRSRAAWNGVEYRRIMTDMLGSNTPDGNLLPYKRPTDTEMVISPLRAMFLDRVPVSDAKPTRIGDLPLLIRSKVFDPTVQRVTLNKIPCILIKSKIHDTTRKFWSLHFYLDEEKHFSLIRHEQVNGAGEVGIRIDNSDFREVMPNLYLPFKTTRELYEVNASEALSAFQTIPKLKFKETSRVNSMLVNSGFSDEVFTPIFPHGTSVIDEVNNIQYTAGVHQDLNDVVRSMAFEFKKRVEPSSPAPEELPSPASGKSSSPVLAESQNGKPTHSMRTVLCAALILCALLGYRVLSVRRKEATS